MTTITCKIPERLDAELEALARKRRISKSDIVRQALEKQVQSEHQTPSVSAFDLVKHLCGCLSGPTDLSTNSAYLENLGA